MDVLLKEQLVEIFLEALRSRQGLNVTLGESPEGVEDMLGERSTAVRIETKTGESLLVTPRRIAWETGEQISDIVLLEDLVGYDWISPDLAEKVRLKDEHYDRLFLYMGGAREIVLSGLGLAVYPLMTYLAKALELRSQKVLLRQLDGGVTELISRCVTAAAEGPFFEDHELDTIFAQDRASMRILAAMWTRMNLASPDLRRTVVVVLEMLLERRDLFPAAWREMVSATAEEVQGALAVFRAVVPGDD